MAAWRFLDCRFRHEVADAGGERVAGDAGRSGNSSGDATTSGVGAGRCIPELEISVGIHTGPLSGGLVGSRNRPQFTVIGDTVNDAARVESLGHLSHYTPPLITRVISGKEWRSSSKATRR